jgi:hypothetical protein
MSLDIDARRLVRTVFVCRYPTANQLAEMDQLMVQATGETEKETLLKAARLVLVSMTPGSGPLTLSLDIDAGKEDAAVFTTNGQFKAMDELVKDVDAASVSGELAILQKAISLCLTTVPNLESATIGELREIVRKSVRLSRLAAAKTLEDLNTTDLREVLDTIYVESHLSENERKKSALQSAAAAARRSKI